MLASGRRYIGESPTKQEPPFAGNTVMANDSTFFSRNQVSVDCLKGKMHMGKRALPIRNYTFPNAEGANERPNDC